MTYPRLPQWTQAIQGPRVTGSIHRQVCIVTVDLETPGALFVTVPSAQHIADPTTIASVDPVISVIDV